MARILVFIAVFAIMPLGHASPLPPDAGSDQTPGYPGNGSTVAFDTQCYTHSRSRVSLDDAKRFVADLSAQGKTLITVPSQGKNYNSKTLEGDCNGSCVSGFSIDPSGGTTTSYASDVALGVQDIINKCTGNTHGKAAANGNGWFIVELQNNDHW